MSPDYKSFAVWCVKEAFTGLDLDACSIQDKALELGIIKEVLYDPDVHGDNNSDVEPGDEWFVLVED